MIETLLLPTDTTERCGLILKDDTIVEVQNVAANPETGYEMDPIAVLPYLDLIAATWHTHPDGPSNLSGADYQSFRSWPDLVHIVISPSGVRRYCVDNTGVIFECD